MKYALEDELISPDELEEECVKVGCTLLKWVETEADFKIRPLVEDRFIMRGSYHILADAEKPRVYWHPKFVERLAKLLSIKDNRC